MSLRLKQQVAVSVDSLLPFLGTLSVNQDVESTASHAVDVTDRDNMKSLLRFMDSIEGKEGKYIKLENNKPVFQKAEYMQDLIEANKTWLRFYPPDKPEGPYEYNDWSSYIPQGKNLSHPNPHWIQSQAKKHEYLSGARSEFGRLLRATFASVDQSTGIELENMLIGDGNEEENKEQLAETANTIRNAFITYKDRMRKGFSLTMPPGWIQYYQKIKDPETKFMNTYQSNQRTDKTTTTYAKSFEIRYFGTRHDRWGKTDKDGNHEVFSCDQSAQAWLIYCGYQNSSKTFDTAAVAKMKSQKMKEDRAAAVRQNREDIEQRKRKEREERNTYAAEMLKKQELDLEKSKKADRQFFKTTEEAPGEPGSNTPPKDPDDEELLKMLEGEI